MRGYAHRREGDLRGDRMWEFLDRLFNGPARPRLPRHQPNAQHDGRGNYGLGIKGAADLPRIEYDKIDKIRGLDVVICTTAKTDRRGQELLTLIGAPLPAQLKEENEMAKKSMILKQQAEPKFSTRRYNRCKICGRPPPTCGTTASASLAYRSDPRREEGADSMLCQEGELVPPLATTASWPGNLNRGPRRRAIGRSQQVDTCKLDTGPACNS